MHVTQWTYEARCEPDEKRSDPINIIFGDDAMLSEIVSHLNQMQWRAPGTFLAWKEASDQCLDCGRRDVQNEQLVWPIMPVVGANLLWCYHIRIWRTTDQGNNLVIIAGAHYERASIKRGHKVLSFEDAEGRVAADFSVPPGMWSPAPDSHWLDNVLPDSNVNDKEAENNGYATVIGR